MASVWIRTRPTKDGGKRYRVEYRLGGRESNDAATAARSRRKRLGDDPRRRGSSGELAALRVPDLRCSAAEPPSAADAGRGVRGVAASRVSTSTEQTREHAPLRVRPHLQGRADTAHAPRRRDHRRRRHRARRRARRRGLQARDDQARRATRSRRRSTTTRIDPNPARDKRVKLPKERKAHVPPPLAEHVERVAEALPAQYVLPLLVIDECGPRVNELATAAGRRPRRAPPGDPRPLDGREERALPAPRTARRPVRRAARDAAAARGPRPRRAAVPRPDRRAAADGDHAGVQGDRHAALLAARPAPPARLAALQAHRLARRGGRAARATRSVSRPTTTSTR